jgi:Holliday junction resolvase RusA-like endonuclease
MIKFTIPGPPQGKARARTGKGFAYTPEKTVLYENLIKSVFIQDKCKRVQSEGQPLTMHIRAFYPIPKSISQKVKDFMLQNQIRPTKKPDADNVLKVVADALNGIAYHDDTQIVTAIVEKYYGEEPRVEVEIWEVTG